MTPVRKINIPAYNRRTVALSLVPYNKKGRPAKNRKTAVAWYVRANISRHHTDTNLSVADHAALKAKRGSGKRAAY